MWLVFKIQYFISENPDKASRTRSHLSAMYKHSSVQYYSSEVIVTIQLMIELQLEMNVKSINYKLCFLFLQNSKPQ